MYKKLNSSSSLAICRKGKALVHTSLYPNLQTEEGELHNKGTSKYHKTDKKSTHFVVHVPPSILGFIKN